MFSAQLALGLLALGVKFANAASAQTFAPAAPGGPFTQSGNYTGFSNSTLPVTPVVAGKSFDRFIQIWLENTDYKTAATTATLENIAKQGLLLTNYVGVTHPSQPNYLASVGGDFWGLDGDDYLHIPSNISTIVDLLDQKEVSWASYNENSPTDGFTGSSFASHNYLNPTKPDYTYFVRKHDPLIVYDSIASVPSRAARVRNFNDMANDLVNGTLPQWVFITPNMIDDGHDTTINFAGDWANYFLTPLLKDTRFNDNRTLILLTFDESETYTAENRVYSVLLGGALPSSLVGTKDNTFYTHYSTLSSVQANWGLGSLGRQDTNKTMSNVFKFMTSAVGYKNVKVTNIPETNLTGTIPGPLNSQVYWPFIAPNMSAVGAGKGPVFVASSLNTSLTTPQPVNLAALGETNPNYYPTS